MALRVKSIISVILSVTFIFVTINTFLSQQENQESQFPVVRGAGGLVDDFKAARLPQGRKGVLSFIGLDYTDDGSAAASKAVLSEWDVDPTKETTHHRTYEILNDSQSTERPPSISMNDSLLVNGDIHLLIGVMSPHWESSRRYIMRHAYNQFSKNLPVDVVFVQGDAPPWNKKNAAKVTSTQRTEMLWENNSFHDILHLDCEENLEEGKTYEYFKKVGLEFSDRYTHVMKTDDDSFVNIPGTTLAPHAFSFSSSSLF